jgi:hypothetical protein
MTLLLDIESYPKIVMLSNGTRIELWPLEQGDKVHRAQVLLAHCGGGQVLSGGERRCS